MTAERVLVLDDDPGLVYMAARALRRQGYEVMTATSGPEAVELARREHFDLLLTDIYMPDMSGLDAAHAMRAVLPELVVVVMTGEGTMKLAVEALNRGAQGFIVKPFTLDALTQRLADAMDRFRLTQENLRLRVLAPMLEETVGVLAAAIDARDPLTGRHVSRLPALAEKLARAAGVERRVCDEVRHGATLHDIGKIGVPDHILRKPGPLTPEEMQQMRRHPALGASMVANVGGLKASAGVIRHHHEWWNGRGYPDGLSGEHIPIGARILSIVDAYDAMMSRRPYRDAMPAIDALAELRRAAGSQFDPRLVDLFVGQVVCTLPRRTSADPRDVDIAPGAEGR